jgi:hypothetical protein
VTGIIIVLVMLLEARVDMEHRTAYEMPFPSISPFTLTVLLISNHKIIYYVTSERFYTISYFLSE